MDREKFLECVGDFTYCWGADFFIETEFGNFHWKDPDYNGDNTITPFDGNLDAFYKKLGVPFGRDKGKHFVKDYCGTDFKLYQR